MNKKLVIEKLSENNFENFAYLIKKLAEYEDLTPPDKDAVNRLKKDGLSEDNLFEAYLGRVNDTYVSYVILFKTYSSFIAKPILYLEDIFVLEECRKKGIGQKMFDFCKNKAKEEGCGRMDWCVLDWNKPAINFYKKNKAISIGETHYRLDEEKLK